MELKNTRNEINKKVSKKLSGRYVKKIISKERWKEINYKRIEKYNSNLLKADYSTLSFERLKKRIMLEQDGKCERCKLFEWLGEEITLELEHTDGNHYNNERGNLKALCPNCHSLTSTWRGRNKKNSNRCKISDEKLLETLLKYNFNMRQSLISVGLAAKGGNYGRCHKLKREYEELE